MILEFEGAIWYWRGPAPWYFVTVPEGEAASIRELSRMVTYGWGMIPAEVKIGGSTFQTALWPKDGAYIVPIRAAIRKAEGLEEGDVVTTRLTIE